MGYVLGIDFGTSYFKAGIFDQSGKLCGLGRQAVVKDNGGSSICELPTERFWAILKEAIDQAAANASISPKDIEAIGYSSQANSFLLLDEDDAPLTPLILWPDTRGEKVYEQVSRLWSEPDFMATTGIGIDASCGFMVNKLQWFKDKEPSVWAKTKRVKTISDYLIFGLTGNHYSDLGTASLLGILDARNACWWKKAIDILGIDEGLLSKTIRSGSYIGKMTAEGSKRIGLKKAIVVYAGSLDHHIAASGQKTEMSESTGTVIACVNSTDVFKPQKNVCISNSTKPGEYFQLAFNENGGVSLEWYKKLFAPNYSLKKLDEMAEKVGSAAGLVALPMAYKYKGLEAFEGVTHKHTHGHFVRAIMESVAISLKELILKLNDGEFPTAIASTGGGAKSSYWLQIKSDITNGCQFIPADCEEPACKGAAQLCQNAKD